MKKLEQFIIPESEDQSRLDRCLRRNLGKINQSLLEKSLRNKHILLNGKKAKASDKIEKNQIITYVSSLFLNDKKVFSTISKNKKFFYLDLYKKTLIKDNKNWFILNKPNKIAVQGGTGQNKNIDELLRSISIDYQFKLVKIKGEFIWHNHENTDEAFIVLEGKIFIEFEQKTEEINEGEMIVVPKGIKHKPYADSEAKIMIIEPKGVINTGDIKDKLTAPNDDWI